MVGVRKRHKGKIYLSVSGAAASLGTNAAKIKQLMSDGTLDWCNPRVNGPLFITEDSPVSAGRMGLSVNFGLLPGSGLRRDLQFQPPPGRQGGYGRA